MDRPLEKSLPGSICHNPPQHSVSCYRMSSWPLCGGALCKSAPLSRRGNREKCVQTLSESSFQRTKAFTSERVLLRVKNIGGEGTLLLFSRKTKLSFPFIREVFSVLKLAVGLPGIYLLCRKCSVRQSVTNNELRNTPQTSTVFYLAERNYFSVQSMCNWHWLNKKLQPLKALFIISCKSADFAVN